MDSPLISIVMITYGHESYIKQAISSILDQKCTYPIEFIIANDCSPDNTDSIIKEIILTNPKAALINYTLHKENRGVMGNFQWVLQQAKGKYIAICEGDDYWTDPLKLQKQVDFLEGNPDYSICCSNVYLKREPANKLVIRNKMEGNKSYTIMDLAEAMLINTASVLLRANAIQLPEWFSTLKAGDNFLFLHVAKSGKIYYMERPMAVYRLNATSIWASKPMVTQLEQSIEQLEIIKQDHEPQVVEILNKQILELHFGLVLLHSENKELFANILTKYINSSDDSLRTFILEKLRLLATEERKPLAYKRDVFHVLKARIRSLLNK